MKVLVTGGTGFVGQYLVKKLIEQEYEVCCLVRSESKASVFEQSEKLVIKYGDVTKAETLKGISEGVDYVIHLAAKGVVEAVSKSDYEEFLAMNETGTRNLLNVFRGSKQLKKFVHFSSTAAMGTIDSPILNEETVTNPKTPYQKSKKRSEDVVQYAWEKEHIPTVILRPCMIYGSGGKKGEYYKFCKLMKKGYFPKVGLGKNLTPMVYVSDVADAAILAMQNGRPGNVYIIADKCSYEMDEFREEVVSNLGIRPAYVYVPGIVALGGAKVVEILCKCVGKTPIVTYRNIKSTINNRTFDISKAVNELKYEPKIDMRQGTKITIRWYKEQGLI